MGSGNLEQNTEGGIDFGYCCYCNQESLCFGRRENEEAKGEGDGRKRGGGREENIFGALCPLCLGLRTNLTEAQEDPFQEKCLEFSCKVL